MLAHQHSSNILCKWHLQQWLNYVKQLTSFSKWWDQRGVSELISILLLLILQKYIQILYNYYIETSQMSINYRLWKNTLQPLPKPKLYITYLHRIFIFVSTNKCCQLLSLYEIYRHKCFLFRLKKLVFYLSAWNSLCLFTILGYLLIPRAIVVLNLFPVAFPSTVY